MDDDGLTRDATVALAWSEAAATAGTERPVLALWRPAAPAVVLGLAQDPARDALPDACRADGVAVLRRASGGGAVLLARGVLCWEALAPAAGLGQPGLREAYDDLSRPVVRALAELGLAAERKGISDLAVAGLKIAGLAQLRKRSAVLVHGSLLADADVAAWPAYLPFPRETPDYRDGRPHRAFCRTVSEWLGRTVSAEELAPRVSAAAQALGWTVVAIPPRPEGEAARLWREKYSRPEWHERAARG